MMQSRTIKSQIISQIDVLPIDMQKKVLDFVKLLSETKAPTGASGSKLAKLAGIMTKEDAQEMAEKIAEGCEKIDFNEW
jgi:hypothetical protein